jgi:hypothetical protein
MITFINPKQKKVFSKSVEDISTTSIEMKKWAKNGWFGIFTVAASRNALVPGWSMLYAPERKKLEKEYGITTNKLK